MVSNYTQQDVDNLIRTMVAEGDANDPKSQAAVGYTVLNRTNDPRWPSSITDVVHQPKQYSAWNQGAGGNSLVNISPNDPRYQRAALVAKGILSGEIQDPTGGATNYYSPSGMNSLVASGSQTNATPPWLSAENQQRGSAPVQVGSQIFTGKTNAPPQGGMYPDPGKALYTDPAASSQYNQDNTEEDPQTQKYDDWVQKNMPWLPKTRSGSDRLLAIGAGLLSGKNWSEGLANASKGLMAVNDADEARDQRNQDEAAEFQRKNAEIDHQGQVEAANDAARVSASLAKGDTKMYGLGNVLMPDGNVRADLSMGTDGRVYTGAGTPLDPDTASKIQKVNPSDSYGSKGEPSFSDWTKMSDKLSNDTTNLQSMDRVYSYMSGPDAKQGASLIAQQLKTWVNTLTGRGLTKDQIQRAIINGDAQTLIGSSREATLGPGPMTEQDAARLATALGGDYTSALSNPEVIAERLKQMRYTTLHAYNTDYNQAKSTVSKYKNLGFTLPDAYVDPYPKMYDEDTMVGRGQQAGGPSDAASGNTTFSAGKQPKPDGVSDSDWKYLSDDEQRQFLGLPAQSSSPQGMPDNFPFGEEIWAHEPDSVKQMWLKALNK